MSFQSCCSIGCIGLMLLLTGCGSDSRNTGVSDQEKRIQDMEARIAKLTAALEAKGRGAYADGPTLQIDGKGKQTILESLHHLEEQLVKAQSTVEDQLALIEQQDQILKESNAEKKKIILEKALLEKFRESTEIARHELKNLQQQLELRDAQLRSSERQRLEIEQAFAEFAADFLKLRAMDTKKFDSLQKRLRDRVEQLLAEHQTDKDKT